MRDEANEEVGDDDEEEDFLEAADEADGPAGSLDTEAAEAPVTDLTRVSCRLVGECLRGNAMGWSVVVGVVGKELICFLSTFRTLAADDLVVQTGVSTLSMAEGLLGKSCC